MNSSWQIEKYLETNNGRLTVDGVSAVELANQYGTPLFVFSEKRIHNNIARLAKAKDVIDCPLKICYAAKAMSTMAILQSVRDAGCDIEVNSGGELWKALKVGFAGEQIIFNGTSKEVWELESAIENEIYAIQVDSVYELALIDEVANRIGKKANVSLRLVPEIESNTHSGLQTALLTSKFGMMPDEALAAFGEYKDSPNLNLAGIHLHIGSQNPSSAGYSEAFELLFLNLHRIYTETGISLSHINLGGGFPVNYLRDRCVGDQLPDEQREMFEADYDPADAIRNAWHVVSEAANAANAHHLLANITLLIEPGRSIVADAGTCLTTVRNIKSRPVNGGGPGSDNDIWLLTDAGFNILLSMETYKWYYHLLSAERAEERHDSPYKLAGPLCDGGDVYFDIEGLRRLPDHRLLPKDVQAGEVLALLNCGAYSLAQASQYNGRFLPPVVLIRKNGEAELVRKRDSFEDLIASDVFQD
jgi:diaminopimelate decarboxylase